MALGQAFGSTRGELTVRLSRLEASGVDVASVSGSASRYACADSGRRRSAAVRATKVIPTVAVLATAAYLAACSDSQSSPPSSVAPTVAALRTFEESQQAFIDETRSDLLAGRFELLDQRADALRQTKARLPGGEWTLYRFHGALDRPLEVDRINDEAWEEQIALLERWRTARPGSIAAVVATADAWLGYGWKARGDVFAHAVSPEAGLVFKARLAKAEALLATTPTGFGDYMQWYWVMLELGRALGWERERMDTLFNEAVAAEPLYLHVYSSRATDLLPRWHGEPGDWERFAEASADRIGGREGSVLYGHIAWQISGLYKGSDFYRQNRVSWHRVKRSFIDREALYGPSLRNLNAYCLLAARAGDIQTVRDLLVRIGPAWDPDVWQERRHFESHRRWAFGTGSTRAVRRGM